MALSAKARKRLELVMNSRQSAQEVADQIDLGPPVTAVAASYTGTPTGCATPVTIDADVAGTAGNVTLTGDGASTIAQLITAWNAANPTNTLTVSAGDDSQTPDNLAPIALSGGIDAVVKTAFSAKTKKRLQIGLANRLVALEVEATVMGGDVLGAKARRVLIVAMAHKALGTELADAIDACA